MSPDTKQLIARQHDSFQKIKQICTNFHKDSASRKSAEYLEKRLIDLKTQWQEFEMNHQILLQLEDKNIEYFNDNIYERTKSLCEETEQEIFQLKRELTLEKAATPATNPSTSNASQGDETASATKTKRFELLRQQQCNFKMLRRTLSKYEGATITERWELEDALGNIKSKWSTIEKTHFELDYLSSETDYFYEHEYNELEKTYDHMKKQLNQKIWNNVHYEKATPRIEIPDFYGNYTQWSSFKDLFTESIHSNPLLAKTQKMQHLKSKLKGEAEKLVQHLPVSVENYDACWDILTHRYDNQRLLFTSYMNTLLNQPIIQHTNAYSIKKLHDTSVECLNGLTNIGVDVTATHSILAHLLSKKLDSEIYAEYIKGLKDPRELPNLEELLNFLESKFMALETLQNGQNPRQTSSSGSQNLQFRKYENYKRPTFSNKSDKLHKAYNTFALKSCPLCKSNGHVLMQCDKFINMNNNARNSTVARLHICKNCLFSHNLRPCNSEKRCKVCNEAHHTLLHDNSSENSTSHPKPRAVNNITDDNKEILLTTVKLKVKNLHGDYVTLRALLDQGSQVSLITESSAQLLQLPKRKISAVVSGVGSISGNSKGLLHLECKSIHSDYTFNIETLIMSKLTTKLPASSFSIDNWNYIDNIKLADPEFNISGPIDMLLGAEVYSELIMDGVMRSDRNLPIAQQTKLGWILCGNVQTFNCFITLNDIENITKFWETEEITQNNKTELSEEEYCENFYLTTTERRSDGKYVLKMPMKPDFEKNLGNSKPQAISQFFQLERRMQRQQHFASQYRLFMQEYLDMGHMKPVTTAPTTCPQAYLPHHGVIRDESTTTKLRVVFNGSQKTNSNYSLNDLMYTGPNLQKDILSLITLWRLHRYAFTADVEKMYRNIMIHENQQQLQKIIWRNTPNEPLREMQLCSLTYGTKSAPYLAMRTLQQLAKDDGHMYPEAAKVLQSHFYMDDLVSSSSDIETAKKLIQDLIALTKAGGFNLRKWASNEPSILENLTEEQKSKKTIMNFKQENSESTKTLGINWNLKEDCFYFEFHLPPSQKPTKRALLSEISCLYDPLGWLSPIIIKTKLLFQKLWLENYSWDEDVPEQIYNEWEKIKTDLANIKKLQLRRWIFTSGEEIELHGFCDASEKAYAAVVYCRARDQNNDVKITLLAAKTKVAPLKTKITLPQMELCGALLLAKLCEKLINTLKERRITCYCWTDSKVVLAWLQRDVTKSERYIANRVKQIRAIIPVSQWSYVKSEENSADCATRGLLPSKLLTFKLWWNGPQWLITYEDLDPKTTKQTFYTETGLITNCFATNETNNDNSLLNELLNKYSTLTRVIRVVSWIRRFIQASHNKISNYKTYLSKVELAAAMELLVKHIQNKYFQDEISQLKKKKTVSKGSLLKLNPILDEKELLRVGGRLENSLLPYETKHPIILPSCKLTELIINYTHKLTLHGGARLTLAQIREKYWILGGQKTVKKQLRLCVKCDRFKPHANQQIMGQLPEVRVTPSRPFTNTGVDYTGHVDLKINKGKGVRTSKGYIAVFICMGTKAVHLELVSDLSTETFLAALKRMCARRGRPKNIYSDNGTNFVGAAKILKQDFIHHQTFSSPEFYDTVDELNIEWHFNAPLWPTGAGIWEASVRSMKYHLRRVIGEQKLTYEQFSTLLAQVEACMNSRPLCALTEDIEDLEYLTPGHFLTGGPLLSLPYGQDLEDDNLDLRNRWKLIDRMNLHIWKRWSQEYLQQMQVRSKWQKPTPNLETGDIVLLKENNLPPGKWALGRVTKLHPGADGYVRVATLKTKNGCLKRPITKLSRLPIHNQTTSAETSETKQQKNIAKTSVKTRKGCLAIMMTLLFFFMTPVTSTHQPEVNHKVVPIENQPIYFDNIGKIKLIHDDWALLMYYNLTTYWSATKQINICIDHIRDICNTVKSAPCDAIANQLDHERRYLIERNNLLITSPRLRRKRGYFNGVGSLARTLFGTLDEEFAIKYEKDIENLRTNDNYLKQLIKNQTLIIEAENNIVQRNEKIINDQFQIIHNFMNETRYDIQQLETRVGKLFIMNDANAISLTASLILSNLHRTQEMMLDALVDIHNGHLDMHLFSSEQLIQQLSIISSKLPTGLSLPVTDIHQNMAELYKLISIKARITRKYFLLELHIPLISDEEYTIYSVIPIPFKKNDRWHVIETSTTYIAINFASNSYLNIQENEMSLCTSYNIDNYICSLRQPIYKLHNENAPCEIKIFNQQRSLSCTINEITCKDKWVKLHKSNIWLFTCCDTHLLRIICGDQVTSAAITGTGLIALQEGCVIQKEDATIYSYNHFGSEFNLKTSVEVPTLDSSINKMMNVTWHNTKLNIDFKKLNNTEAYSKIKQSLADQKLKENESFPSVTDLSQHDIFHYAFACVVAGGAGAAIIVFIIRRKLFKKVTENASAQQHVTSRVTDAYARVARPAAAAQRRETSHYEDIELQQLGNTASGQPQKANKTFNFDLN